MSLTKEIEATYKNELVGRGILEKHIRLYQDGNRFAVLEPSFSGWTSEDLDQIEKALISKGIVVEEK